MAVFAWLVVLVLLTTGDCIGTVKTQDYVLRGADFPFDSPEAADSPADSLQADNSPSDASSLDEGSPTDSSPDRSSADFVPADGWSVDSAEADGSPADSADRNPAPDSSPSDSPPVESPPDISTNNPPALFVFGDSLVDPGNNNYIQTLAKANMLFNGIDFPGGPTGRFCNGRTVVDILCDILAVPYPPPFLDPQANGSRILRGVNYASGAAGILDATGANFLNRVSMNQQMSFLQETTLPQLEALLGTDKATTLLASSLVVIVIGSNDYINHYLLLDSVRTQYTPAEFNVLLVNSFRRQLMELYGFGLRMFFVSGIGPLGCIPHQLAISGQPTCVLSVNAEVQDFNALIKSMLQDLNTELPDAMFLFGDSYNSLSNIIHDPSKYGFKVVNEGCCGGGTYRAQILCQPMAALCLNRNEYVFWDAYHPTEASNLLLANAMYTGGPKAASPMNVQQLLARRQ